MNTTAIRTQVAEYIRVGFTMSEAFENMKASRREVGRKTNKVAEARARVEEATGIERKSWAETKFGKQHNF